MAEGLQWQGWPVGSIAWPELVIVLLIGLVQVSLIVLIALVPAWVIVRLRRR